MKTRILIVVLSVFITTSLTLGDATAETMRKIFERGKIVVGVKADYRPWGFRQPDGEVIGMEIDMAQDVADRLGVKLEKVVVVGANRMEFLNQGKIDVIIATMGDTPKRRRVVGMIEPNYYSGGANLFAKKSVGFKKWSDIKGKKICATQGGYYNKRVTKLYKPEMMAFKGTPEIISALKNDVCAGYLFDSTWIESNLASGDYDEFEMPFETEDFSAWALGVRYDDLNGPFGRFISGVVYEWLQSGKLLEIETKWGVKNSSYLLKMKELLNQ